MKSDFIHASIVATSLCLAGLTAQAESICVDVPGASPSGISIGAVVAGQIYTYTATGCIAAQVGAPQFVHSSDPDGNSFTNGCVDLTGLPSPATDPFICPGLNAVSLVGRINGGACLQLGSSGSFTAADSGQLVLYFNDQIFGDNSGAWHVCLTPAPTQVVTHVCGTVSAANPNGDSFGTVVAGQTYTYTATGCVALQVGAPQFVHNSDPDGNVYTNDCNDLTGTPQPAGNTFTCPGLSDFSLVGRINGGNCFQLGSTGSFTPPVGGELVLYFNDEIYGDNSGTWNVCINPTTNTACTTLSALDTAVAQLDLSLGVKHSLRQKLQLRAFVHEVRALKRSGQLDNDTAKSLIDCAEAISPGSSIKPAPHHGN